jgi:putative ABC transport system permease protein
MTLVVRATGTPSAIAPSVRNAIRELDPNLPVADVRSMTEVVGAALSTPRFTSVLLSMFALIVRILIRSGYLRCSPTWSLCTRDRIRVAIGADRGQVLRMVLANGLTLATVGVVAGVFAALVLTRLLRGLLHGVSQLIRDVRHRCRRVARGRARRSLAPAWRAMRVDPWSR